MRIHYYLLAPLFFLFFKTAPAQTIFFVDSAMLDNSGAGTTWATAKRDIQNAINIASYGDQIWVKKGTYRPTLNTSGGTTGSIGYQTIYLKNGVKIYGGFIGNETLLSQRDWQSNTTIFSGDINKNDIVSGSGTSIAMVNINENANHVILSVNDDSTTCIDGFIIKRGYAGYNISLTQSVNVESKSIFRYYGAGVYLESSNLTIVNCTITENWADLKGAGIFMNNCANAKFDSLKVTNNIIKWSGDTYGVGIYNKNSNITLQNCIVSGNLNNSLNNCVGAGMYNDSSTLMIKHCAISNNVDSTVNTSENYGGGMYANYSNVDIDSSLFTNNSVGTKSTGRWSEGGAIYAKGGILNINHSVISRNTATSISSGNGTGGGIYYLGSFLTINNSVIASNSALSGLSYGGGIHAKKMFIANSTIDSNIANVGISGSNARGGGIKCDTITMLNCSLSKNSTDGSGGGVWVSGNISNCTFIGNSANYGGGAQINAGTISNCNFSENTAKNAGAILSVGATISDCIVSKNNAINGNYGGIEANNCSVLNCSISENKAINGGGIGGNNIVVDRCTIQKNTASNKGGGLNVSTYFKKNIITRCTFSKNKAGNVGGGIYIFTAYDYDSTLIDSSTILLDTASLGGGIYIENKGINRIKNTTIAENNAIDGAGIYAKGSPTLAGCSFLKNSAQTNGGGGYFEYANISFCTFQENYALKGGGGYSILSPTFTGCSFSKNSAQSNGGGLSMNGGVISSSSFQQNNALNGGGLYTTSGTTITNCSLIENSSLMDGGGMYNERYCIINNTVFARNTALNNGGAAAINDDVNFNNAVFTGNKANSKGGALYFKFFELVDIRNSTFSKNTALSLGGGIFIDSVSGTNGKIRNCIFWNDTTPNTTDEHYEEIFQNSSKQSYSYNSMSISYSIIKDYTGVNYGGNQQVIYGAAINALNPLFENELNPAGNDTTFRTADDGLRLQIGSPAINAGDTAIKTPATDIIGISRNLPKFDLGAYEQCATNKTINQILCGQDSFYFNGSYRTQSGTYLDTLTNTNGCDSLITLNLSLLQQTSSTITSSACNFYWYNNKSFTQSGTYVDTLKNASGCDSIITLILTINQPTTGTITQSACGQFTFQNQTYTQSGVHTFSLVNAIGCDSLVTLNLTIKQPSVIYLTQNACDSFIFKGKTLKQSGTYNDTLQNSDGCDSIISLGLNIRHSNYSIISQNACDSYIFNNQTLTQSGVYKDTFTNAAGCDSFVTLNLTINANPLPSITNSGYNLSTQHFTSYQWQLNSNNINGASLQNYTATQNGNYTVSVTDSNGCMGTSMLINITGVGINKINANELFFDIHPNPATTTLLMNCNSNGLITVKVLNANGQLASSFKFENSTILNIENWAQGLYIIYCVDEDGYSSAHKFLKE